MMFCRHCGKQVPDDSAFCQHCGNQLSIPGEDTSQPKNWERLTLIIHYRKGEGGWVLQEKYPGPVAQQHFWNEALPSIQELETMFTDEGWQAVGKHGPACVELASYKSAEGKSFLAEAIGVVASFGTSLLFAKSWKFTIKSITLKWRRPTIEESAGEEDFHLWFNSKTKEFERWELDKTTKRWFPMEMDQDGNWRRKQRPPKVEQQSNHTKSSETVSKPAPSSSENENLQTLSLDPPDVSTEEEEILKLLAKGLSNPEIAEQLKKNPVETSLMVTDMLNRFEVETKDELIKIATEKLSKN